MKRTYFVPFQGEHLPVLPSSRKARGASPPPRVSRASIVLLALLGSAAACGGGSSNSDGGDPSGCVKFGDSCLFAPTVAATRTPCGEVTDFCDPTMNPTPNLTCLGAATTTPPATPAVVTLTGFIHVFSSGPDAKGLTVQIFKQSDLVGGADPATLAPLAQTAVALDPATQRACDAAAKNGCSLPSKTGCTLPVCNDGLNGRNDDKKYCRDLGAGQSECSDRLRWEARYSIPNVPTNTQLVIRSTGPSGKPDTTWATMVIFNIVPSTADPACKGPLDVYCLDTTNAAEPKYQLDINALSQSDYVNIPTTSGLAGGISNGMGAIAGEVHDCDNIRVGNVQVGVSPEGDRFTYFNGNPLKTLPDSGRVGSGTDRLGLYAALNVKPGNVTVQTAALTSVGGALTSFGNFTAIVYPNTVSVANVNGGRPNTK